MALPVATKDPAQLDWAMVLFLVVGVLAGYKFLGPRIF